MPRFAKVALIVLGVYVLLGIIFDSLVAYFQPQDDSGATLIIQTQDEDGKWIDTVLSTRINTKGTTSTADDELWVESGHWFRGWYWRLVEKPKVYVIRHGGTRTAYTAVLVNTPEAVEMMTGLMGKHSGFRYWVARALLFYAPIKPVRLDPGH